MQLAELDNLYNELKAKEEITITPDCVVSVLETAGTPLSIDKIVENIEMSVLRAATPKAVPLFQRHESEAAHKQLTMGGIFNQALKDAFAEKNADMQNRNLNRILFPVMMREGMAIHQNGARVNATPNEMLAFFQSLDASPGGVRQHEKYIFFSKSIPENASATCASLKLKHLPPGRLAAGLKAYMRKTAAGPKIVLCCEDLQPFTPSTVAMRHYNRVEMKLVKTSAGPRLVSWAVGVHPDHPVSNEMDRVCLLGKQAAKQ